MKNEIELGLESPAVLIERYFKAFDLAENKQVPFNLFPRQREFVENLTTHQLNIADKHRQAGVSTCTAAYLATAALLSNPQKPDTIVICANKLSLAKNMLSNVRGYLAQFPTHLWGDNFNSEKTIDGHILGRGAEDKITLVNGVKIIAKAATVNNLHNCSPTILVIDEAAFVPQGRELYATIGAFIATGSKIIIMSTPNGYDDLFHKIYESAIKGDNNFKVTNFRWYEDQRYNKDLKWELCDDKGGTLIGQVDTLSAKSPDELFNLGYKPTSSWYKRMCAYLNEKAIAQELDVKFE